MQTVRRTCPSPRQPGTVAAMLLATVLAAAHPSAAITYIMPSDGSMVDRTGTIVFGRVLFAAAAPDGLPLPATDFTVTVEEVLKGAVAGGTIVVRQPGGARSDGLAMRIAGLPMLQEGERVLLFLTGQRSGESGALTFHRVVEFGLGIFFEVPVEGGVLLEREPSLRNDVMETGPDAGAETVVGLRDGAPLPPLDPGSSGRRATRRGLLRAGGRGRPRPGDGPPAVPVHPHGQPVRVPERVRALVCVRARRERELRNSAGRATRPERSVHPAGREHGDAGLEPRSAEPGGSSVRPASGAARGRRLPRPEPHHVR